MHVIATAGHVDHGKSTLLRALTGSDPDRWAEEHRRGMTIDLGYVWTTLDDAGELVFVDVPGHERFVTTMLAGVGPVPAALLVIAADEGWCRQTEEHVAALEALGVRHGVLAVTRCDLASAEPALTEAADRLAGTGLAGFEPVVVSGATGDGVEALRHALARLVAALPTSVPSATRLWADRVFTVRGAGTVVTGTLTGGELGVGDELELAPTGEPVHVKAIECLNTRREHVTAVARVAVNLRGVDRDRIQRGDALVAPGRWSDVSTMDVTVHEARRWPTKPMLHVGSAATQVHLRPLGEHTARLRLRRAVPVHVGEHAVLRDPGTRHVAGAVVLDIDPPPLLRRGAAARRDAELATMTGEPDPDGEVRRRGVVTRTALVAAGVLAPDAPAPENALDVRGWLVHERRWHEWRRELVVLADRRAREHPLAPGLAPTAVARALRLPDRALVEPLVASSRDLVADGDGVRRARTRPALPDDAAKAVEGLREELRRAPFTAPDVPALTDAGLTTAQLATADRLGLLLKLADGVYLLPSAPAEATRRLAGLGGPFTVSEARRALNTSRRVAVPLLELLDATGVTVRTDDNLRELVGEPTTGKGAAE